MAPAVDPVEPDETLPRETDVVVIGGGIAGVATAYFLAERGIPVVLCEKGRIAGEQSSRNWGWCRQMGRDPRELPLIIESLRLWRGMNERLGAETGFRQRGLLYLAETEAELAGREAWLDHARPFQLDSRLIGTDEVAALLPGLARRYAGGLYTPGDGAAEPAKAVPAMATAARKLGARVFTGCAVRGLEREAGRVSAVVTEKGAIKCRTAVLAGGAWSRAFCRALGITLPQLTVRASVLRTAAVTDAPETSLLASGVAMRKRLDDGYTVANGMVTIAEVVPASFRHLFDFLPLLRVAQKSVRLRLGRRFLEEWRMPARWPLDRPSPFERHRVLDPAPVGWVLEQARANLARIFPAFAGIEVTESWAGYIDATPDAVPVISPADALPGLFLATGFSGHGFGIGPGAGRLMADLVSGDAPVVDPAPYRFTRFSDGTRPTPTVGL